ncbi:bifunctional Pre-mRNA-splicing factor SLU7/CBF1-interacting co-repressor CIR [Babesia duncani]|uniref:Pre-mRNA-splicing factor SLU7 n=1 Tax=Babesia duncani TaxID=323732 RepID=A0AAD9PMK3_9APIC|nr:bifunctional Pre-mRNA-splicing factor SLU7/CBF1-interacting co-repressor CIR [Babesia duncani]
MWMGKIGNKSAAFINHKHFHPGSIKNMERVWLAEEKHKAELKRQKEMREKREEEVKIAEIRKQIREQEELKRNEFMREARSNASHTHDISESRLANVEGGIVITKSSDSSKSQTNGTTTVMEKPVIRSMYPEDVYEKGHTSIFGSYYDMETGKWGYKCCMQLKRQTYCTSEKARHKRKRT